MVKTPTRDTEVADKRRDKHLIDDAKSDAEAPPKDFGPDQVPDPDNPDQPLPYTPGQTEEQEEAVAEGERTPSTTSEARTKEVSKEK